jgi:uncharacterized protein (TIGR00299 family) protein
VKILYYDCFAGISGDMNLGALLDLGVDHQYLLKELGKLPIGSFKLNVYQDRRGGITGTKVNVVAPARQKGNSDNRAFSDIAKLINQSKLSVRAKKISLEVFTLLARAEAKIHGQKISNVRFHEIGAIDSIVDIVGAAICLDHLKLDKIISSPLQLGSGVVHCCHGVLPVPAPATAEILKGIPVKTGLVPFEATTPTGAAIITATASSFTEHLEFTPLKIGYGLGDKESSVPNVLRVFVGEQPTPAASAHGAETAEAVLMECNLDDMNPEFYDYLMERLFAAGAQDVFITPIIMKKSRPAATVSVLCDAGRQHALEHILWLHSSTFGLRFHRVIKSMLPRKTVTVKTPYGDVGVKCGYLNGRVIKTKPEYEDCKKLAREKGVALRDVYKSASSKIRKKQ